jgi:hypothetical protein
VKHCRCAHSSDVHDDAGAGRCTVSLPPFEEEELPAWSCPCRRFEELREGDVLRWDAVLERWGSAA